MDFSQSDQIRFSNLKHKIFSDFTPNKTNLSISTKLEEKLLWYDGSQDITHVMLKLVDIINNEIQISIVC